MLAASFPEAPAEVFHSLADLGGVPEIAPDALTVLLADPYTFPTDTLIDHLGRGRSLVGGLTGGGGAGQARLFRDGGVAARRRDRRRARPARCARRVVSQGCRPIGPELVVTAAAGNALLELAGIPALEKIEEVFGELSDADQALGTERLLSGLVIDENRPEYGVGDYLVRVLLGADRERGAIMIGDVPRVGQTFRLHVRDEASATAELEHVLRAAPAVGRRAGVLVQRPRPQPVLGRRPRRRAWSTSCSACPRRASSARGRSDRSAAATTCTASRPRSRCSASA